MFCNVYEELFHTRAKYPKKSAENLLYKLALNGVYGDSNNQYGPFLDPRYTMTITINGQLSLCVLSEWLLDRCGAEMLMANTDGITVLVDDHMLGRYFEICREWEEMTQLQLEFAEYKSMQIRDCNSYLAHCVAEWKFGDAGKMIRTPVDKIKRVGAYQHLVPIDDEWLKQPERGWHQDHSALIVPKAAEAVMLRSESLEHFIRNHTDPFDFMLRVKVPRSSRLVMAEHDFPTAITKDGCVTGYRGDMPRFEQVQNICRYFIARDGQKLVKIMPPTKAPRPRQLAPGQTDHNPLDERYIGVEASHRVELCNVATDFDWSRLDYSYYIEEARKLILTPGDLFANVG